jgi:hypothetical protein
MDFLNISSLGVVYRYAIKIEHKFRHQNKWEFGSANMKQPKHGKDCPNQQPLNNQFETKDKKGKVKMKNDTRKWCDFHKIPQHNTDECHSKQSLVVKVKDTELNPDSESDPENIENIHIIDTDPTATVATTKIQLEEPIYLEEGERLFHSHMWVNKTPLHFIVDNDIQKNLISAKVIKQLGLSITPHLQPTTLGGFTRDEIFMSSNSVSYPMSSIPSRMR